MMLAKDSSSPKEGRERKEKKEGFITIRNLCSTITTHWEEHKKREKKEERRKGAYKRRSGIL